MGIDLSGAMPRQSTQSSSAKSPKGVYKALWTGMSEKFEVANDFESCRRCQGTKTDETGAACFVCHGSGKRTDEKVTLQYLLSTGIVEEESVNFKLGSGGLSKDKRPISASTLYTRLSELSGFSETGDIQNWAKGLGENIRIPCVVMIGYYGGQTALPRILSVQSRGAEPADAGFKPLHGQTGPSKVNGGRPKAAVASRPEPETDDVPF